jgi:hypothetical protein
VTCLVSPLKQKSVFPRNTMYLILIDCVTLSISDNWDTVILPLAKFPRSDPAVLI